jgi:multiple sugar transport system permease protein
MQSKFLVQYEKREVRNAYAFLTPILIVIFLFILFPVIGTLWKSFYQDTSFLPFEFVGFRNYAQILSDTKFWSALVFTLLFALATVVLEAVFGLIFALLLNESFKGRGIMRAVILIPWAIPTIVSAQIWRLMYDYTYGIINHLLTSLGFIADKVSWMGTTSSAFWALVISDVWKTTPFVVIILLAGLQAIPQDIYKQARVDGAKMFKRFRSITLPLVAPVLLIALIFRTIDAIRIFDLVYVLTGGAPGGTTETLSFIGYNYFTGDIFGMGSAISVITFIVSFMITILYIKLGRFEKNIK